jgi:hypothetical protein
VAAFEADQRGDPPRLEGALDIGAAVGGRQVGRVFGNHPPRQLDLFHPHARPAGLQLARHVGGPELHAQVALAHARDVGFVRHPVIQVVAVDIGRRRLVFGDDDRQVVVAVHQRRRFQQRMRAAQVGGIVGEGKLGQGDQAGGQHGQAEEWAHGVCVFSEKQ